MLILLLVSALLSNASLIAWVWLVAARGGFWRTDQQLGQAEPLGSPDDEWPSISVVIPARNEADTLPRTLPIVLGQDYPGRLHTFLVDDHSEDGTSEVARQIASDCGAAGQLTVVAGEPLPARWTGKLWALQQGLRASEGTKSEFVLFTDADIAHAPNSLRALAHKAQDEELDLVSLMAWLRVETAWEHLLIPAFVYFFAKLYPFRWASDPRRSTAAAAGGCILVRREALESSGGLEPMAGELIDDCALASRIKKYRSPMGGRIWLGLTQDLHSVRAYRSLGPIWRMVTRSAFAQLNFSAGLLLLTVLGMLFLYLLPPLATVGGLVAVAMNSEGLSTWLAATGISAWMLMDGSYLPMLRWHTTSPLYAPLLPITAMLYTLMTIDSALRWRRGQGGAWKGRTYPAGSTLLPL